MNKTFRKLGGVVLCLAALSMTSCDIVGVPDNASGKYVVKINTEDMVLYPGETASRPSTNATAGTTYTSSDPAVATVDNAGRVTAVAEGTCVITVSTPFLATKTIEGDEILSTATAEYKVIVQPNLASALKEGAKIGFAFNLNGEDLDYLFEKQGDDYVLIPQNQQQSAPRRAVVESQLIPVLIYAKTNNTLILTVFQQVGQDQSLVLMVIFNLNDNTIQIIPGSPLTKVLNFKVRIGNIEITAQLTKKEVAPTSVKFTGAETPFKMKVGEEITLDASVEPVDATDKAVTWTSSKPEVATVDANGKVTAIAAGETTIKVATSNGKFYEQALTVEAAVLNTYLKWDEGQKKLVATEIPATAHLVTPTTLTPGVNLTCLAAATFVIAGEVTIGTITLSADVNLIIKDGAKLTVNQIAGGNNNLRIYGQAQKKGELVVNCSDNDAIHDLSTLEVHSAKVTATSSASGRGGFYNIDKFNVYGGLVDAKCTAADEGYGICLKAGGSLNIWGGEVKAEGKGDSALCGYGITCGASEQITTVKVYGGKLLAWNASNQALNSSITLVKGTGFSGGIQTCDDGTSWTDYTTTGTPTTKYVRVGY